MERADTMEELMHLLEETPREATSLTFFALKAFSGIVEKPIFKSIYKHHPEHLIVSELNILHLILLLAFLFLYTF